MTQSNVAEVHDAWVKRYLTTVDKRFKPTDSPDANMYNVDLDANGAELDEFFDTVEHTPSVVITTGAFGFQVTNIVTAAGKHHVNVPDPDWDESKVKRDSEGKFAKKAGVKVPSVAVENLTPVGTGQVEIHGKPIYINTNVIYKQTYADGTVVAEQPLTNKRLRWDGKKKKFLLQKRHPAGHWETTATYGKGEAYKQLSKETGWFEPTKTIPNTPIVVKEMTEVTAPSTSTTSPKYIDDLMAAAKSANVGDVVAETKMKTGSYARVVKSTPGTYTIEVKLGSGGGTWTQVTDIDEGELKQYFGHQTDMWTPVVNAPATPSTPGVGVIPNFDENSDAKNLAWIMNLTPEEWNQFTPEEKTKINDVLIDLDTTGYADASNFEQHQKMVDKANYLSDLAKVQIGVYVEDEDEDEDVALIAKLDKLDPGQFLTWFNDNVKSKEDYDSYSDPVKAHLKTLALSTKEFFGIHEPAIAIEQYEKSELTTPDMSGLGAGSAMLKQINAMSPTEFEGWFDNNFHQATWNLLSQTDKNNIKHAAEAKNSSLAQDYIKSWEIMDLKPEDLAGLDFGQIQAIENDIDELTTKGFLNDEDGLKYLEVKAAAEKLAGGPPLPPPLPPPTMALPPASYVTGSKYHVDVHSKITPIADIGAPLDPGPNANFHVLTPSAAVAMQKYMLNVHNKTVTSDQVAAVQRYTTSVGYRSTNAVLRDDAEQMKKLTAADLSKGVKNAVDLQSAMSPITSNVRVFRGTGAHAFGQKGIHANFTELKKLEGKTVTDKGFMSTTVLEQPPVTYDYAKKPIQMIVDVPAGSPAAYVTALTPDWDAENELILGAGSTYRIKEVREATELDKKQFGNPTLEHVVHVEIVPGTGNPSHKITTPTDIGKTPKPTTTAGTGTANLAPVTPSVATKPTIGPIKASDLQLPMKLTTTVIHKNKYQHGAVVAYRKNVDGSLSRIFWNAHTKKFVLQNQNASTGMWSNFAGYGKGEAYSQFGKDTNWFAPPPGDSAFGADFQAAVNAPTISNPLPTPSAPTPVTSTAPVKKTKLDAAILQAMHGDTTYMSVGQKDNIFDDFKKGFGYNTHLGTPPEFIFDKLLQVQKKSSAKPNLLQILRVIDEKSTPSGATNEHKYEQKIVDWLKTPDGKTSALDQLNAPAPVPGALPKGAVVSPTGEISHAVAPHSPAIQAVLNKIKKPSDIGTTDPSDTTFSPMTPAQAKVMNTKLQAANPWTTAQQHALITYTGEEYRMMNGVLRNDPKNISHLSEEDKVTYAKLSKNAQDGMRPLPQSVTVYRKTGTKQLPGLGENAKFEDVLAFEGKTFIDRGFFSSSVTEGTWSGNLHMTLEVAKGVPAAWVKQISKNPSENEMLLAAGLKYRVVSVEKGYGNVIKMKLRVEV